MNNERFYSPEEVRPLYSEIVPAYQAAFAGDPWYEVSKCEDRRKRCIGGLSALAIGQTCQVCSEQVERPAYESEELVTRFEDLASARPTEWYAERTKNGLALAAIAWSATPERIAKERYTDVPAMNSWMAEQFDRSKIIWLDEIFANKKVRATGNLDNLAMMCAGFMERLNSDVLAFRTINPRLVAATKRDYGEQATIFNRGNAVPDRRDFVIIKASKEE